MVDQQKPLGPMKNAELIMQHPAVNGLAIANDVILTDPDFADQATSHKILGVLSLTNFASHLTTSRPVPPETGRAVILYEHNGDSASEILLKGTGLWHEATRNNQLRDADRGFSGVLELSEAVRDMVHSELLRQAGVKVAMPVAIVNHNVIADCGGFNEHIGNYARLFQMQTRLSNLVAMTPIERRDRLNEAMRRLKISSLEDYFWFFVDRLAQTAAIYQSIGFTQDSLHFGQVTWERREIGV